MTQRDLFDDVNAQSAAVALATEGEPPEGAPLGGTRAEALQRLQVGLTGLCAMILVIGVASIIGSQADIAEESAVPDASPTTEPSAAPPQRDPLADAGVVPDIPPPEATETQAAPEALLPDFDGNVTVPDTPPTEPLQDGDDPRR